MVDVNQLISKNFILAGDDVMPTVLRLRGREVTRDHLAALIGEAGFKIGAEIGVFKAGYSLKLLNAMKDGKLILIDPWEAYENSSAARGEMRYQKAMKNLDKYKNNIIVKRMRSQDAVDTIEDESLDFVYIDGLHDFNNAAMDLIRYAPKVRKGGIIAGHDYYHGPDFGVVQAVNSYTACNKIKPWYITREGVPSFFWVKQ